MTTLSNEVILWLCGKFKVFPLLLPGLGLTCRTRSPIDPKLLIVKRIVGLPGDRVRLFVSYTKT